MALICMSIDKELRIGKSFMAMASGIGDTNLRPTSIDSTKPELSRRIWILESARVDATLEELRK